MVATSSSEPAAGATRRSAVDIFRERVAASGARVALRHKVGSTWSSLSWNDWDRAAREIAAGLAAAGVVAGERVAIVASTRFEWSLCDIGILSAGAVVVPIYPSSLPDQCEYILRDSGAVLAIAEDPHQLEKL